MFEQWGKALKEPSQAPPPHAVLDWEGRSPAPVQSEPAQCAADATLSADETDYMESNGVNEELRTALRAVLNATPLPADPVAAMGRLISAAAARRAGDEGRTLE